MNRETPLILADIIKNEMSLQDGQIYIYNQDFKLPSTNGLFVVIQQESSELGASNTKTIVVDNVLKENTYQLVKEEYAINIMSQNAEARQRKEEVLLALVSTYSQQKQDLYQIKIAQSPTSFVNVSELEGGSMLNRFVINISVLSWYQKTKTIPYYDQFSQSTINN